MTIPAGSAGSGRLVLITGAGRPGQVSETVARAFRDAGDRVLLVGRSQREADSRASDLGGAARQVFAYAADLANPAQTDALAAAVERDHGARLHVLIHLAGGWIQGAPVADASADYWQRSITANLMTAAFTARSMSAAMRRGHGAHVFFASEAALPGASVGGMAAYAAAKQGVIALMRALAQEERRHGVRANAVAPGSIRTAANEASMGSDVPYVEREEVAATVLWLCSAAASAVTGEVIRLTPRRRE